MHHEEPESVARSHSRSELKRLIFTATERPSGARSIDQARARTTKSGFPGGWGIPMISPGGDVLAGVPEGGGSAPEVMRVQSEYRKSGDQCSRVGGLQIFGFGVSAYGFPT